MKTNIILAAYFSFLFTHAAIGQSVGVGTTTPDNSAALDISSNNKGVLLPRTTSAQRKAIASPATGLLVYDTDKSCLFMFDGVKWQPLVFTTLNNLPGIERAPDSVGAADYFGFSVDISGNYAVAGAPPDKVNGVVRGSAYVFERVNNSWIQTARLIANDGAANDEFGYAVSISGDYIAVSAYGDNTSVVDNHGSVYIFHRVAGVWTQEFKIRPGDFAEEDNFGWSISISGDNLIVGSISDDNGAIANTGSIYFYQRSGTTWTQLNKFYRPGFQAQEFFGITVRMEGDYAIASCSSADVGANVNAGVVCIYVYGGGTWNFQTSINNPANNTTGFGRSVDINSNYAVISRTGTGGSYGFVYTYARTGSTWNFAGQLYNMSVGGGFGLSIGLSGGYLLVGDYLNGRRSAYLYKMRPNTTAWDYVREISFSSPAAGYDQVLYQPGADIVAISGDHCIFGNPVSNANGEQSGNILFLNISD
jgi:FG-GAP repeat